MILVVDTNRIMAALIKDSVSRRIIYSDKFVLLTPNFTMEELEENKAEILRKVKIGEVALNNLLSLILNNLYVVDDSIFQDKFEEAQGIMDKIDPDDTPFIALALAISNDGIWSDDRHFQSQKRIPVWKTPELLKLL